MKYSFVVTGLALLVLANILIVYQYSSYEGFKARAKRGSGSASGSANNFLKKLTRPMLNSSKKPEMFQNLPNMMLPPASMDSNSPMMPTGPNANLQEGFSSFLLSEAGGAKDKYESIGAYDGVQLSTGNNVSAWRYTAPNEKLLGDKFVPGDDSLFMFKNNQCKPECCGASFSCGGGCVCTTPDQRQYLAGRGGNRTQPEDSA
jgi:hypothetical protein